jgi:hypothetical protein
MEVIAQSQRLQRNLPPIYTFLAQSSSASTPAPEQRPAWSVETDPAVPEEFKQKYTSILESFPKGNHPSTIRQFNLTVLTFYRYLNLAKLHFEEPARGVLTKGMLWDDVCEAYQRFLQTRHGADYHAPRPSNRSRARVLKALGLWSLPEYPSGRPSQEY